MRAFLVCALVGAVALGTFAACGTIKNLIGGKDEPETAAPVAGVPGGAKTAPHVPDKYEYYQMLRSGYTPPLHTVIADGTPSSGAGEKREVPEADGLFLKRKFGEGRKYAAAGRGDDPQPPSWVEHGDDDGTYPPREWNDHR